jgi:hypothetical protein
MKTYTLLIDDKPVELFRADRDAVKRIKKDARWWAWRLGGTSAGVRPATIQEQADWRAWCVAQQLSSDRTAEFFAERDPDNRIGLGIFDPDKCIKLC